MHSKILGQWLLKGWDNVFCEAWTMPYVRMGECLLRWWDNVSNKHKYIYKYKHIYKYQISDTHIYTVYSASMKLGIINIYQIADTYTQYIQHQNEVRYNVHEYIHIYIYIKYAT